MCGKLGAVDSVGQSAVMLTRCFPCFARPSWCLYQVLPSTEDRSFFFFSFLFFKFIYLLTWSKGSIQAKRGFLFLEGWARPPWASQRKVYLGQRLDSAGPASWDRHARARAPAPPRAWLPYLSADWHRLCLGSLWRSSRRECRPLPSTPGPWFC